MVFDDVCGFERYVSRKNGGGRRDGNGGGTGSEAVSEDLSSEVK